MTIRSDVVGSLLRPAYLVNARDAFDAGRLAAAEFKRVEDRAVDEAIRLQEAAGLDVVTDGELRRYAFFGHLIDALEGFDKFGGWAIPFRDEKGEQLVFQRPVVVEFEMVVVVVGVFVVLVREVLAQEMVGQVVSARRLVVVGIGHQNLLLQNSARRPNRKPFQGDRIETRPPGPAGRCPSCPPYRARPILNIVPRRDQLR